MADPRIMFLQTLLDYNIYGNSLKASLDSPHSHAQQFQTPGLGGPMYTCIAQDRCVKDAVKSRWEQPPKGLRGFSAL